MSALLVAFCLLGAGVCSSLAATLYGNASIQASDPTMTTGTGSYTVMCWFRISLPSGVALSDNMDILMDRTDGSESANFCYLIRYNATSGNVEFTTRGPSSPYFYTKTLIQQPYLERWYHVAIARSGSTFYAYVDGRPLPSESASIGTASGSGFSIGGINGASKLFYGDIVEAAFYNNTALANVSVIQSLMFQDQRGQPNLSGYYKLGYSTNTSDFYRNFAATNTVASKVGSGTIDFLQIDQAGEQSLFDSRKSNGDSATTPLSGAFTWQQTALARPVPGIAFDFQFSYSTAVPTLPGPDGSNPYYPRVLGPGWRHTFDTRVVPGENQTVLQLITWDGNIETWTNSSGYVGPFYTRHREYRGELVVTNNDVEWTTPERLVYHFHNPSANDFMPGCLVQIRDFNSNSVQIQWDQSNQNKPTNIVDTAGGVYRLNYALINGFSRLTNLSFGSWQVNFTYDANNRLASKSITNASGIYAGVNAAWQFAYNSTSGLLERVSDPRGNTSVVVTYDNYGRKVSEADGLGRTTQTEYNLPANWQMRRTDPGGLKWIESYDQKGHILAQQDPLTNTTSYTYDANGNRISITEPLGWTNLFAYDSRANVIAHTNALGQVTRWSFHPFFNKATNSVDALLWNTRYDYDSAGNLLRQYDDLGTLASYTYTTNGLVETSTDANNHVSRFTYDSNGFRISTTDPANNTWTYSPNDVGWVMSEANPLDQVTAYSYDVNGHVVQRVDPLMRVYTSVFDPNGNLVAQSDAKGLFATNVFDAANQKTQTVDRAGSKWAFTYTPRGKVERVIDPLNNTVTNVYDNVNRLIQAFDPLGSFVETDYDANGNVTNTLDKVGQRWTKTYDRLNRVISETDPLGDTRQTTYDEVGRIKTVTSPNGYTSTHSYDGRGRLTLWVDAQNYRWLYDYDGVGNITNITDALTNHYVMAYGNRNERILERNQDLKEWHYQYDELLRPDQQTDPNGTARSIVYDDGGRIDYVTFSTGRVDDYEYDDNNNLTLLSRSRPSQPPTSTTLDYDLLDRVIDCGDAFGKHVGYGYDALSRVVTLRYPDGKTLTSNYDALRRLTNQMDWAGRQMTYAYDKADRLIRRSWPNGIIQTNAFDSANRLTLLSHSTLNSQPSTLNIALQYAYDRNGNKTASTEKGTLNWPIPALTDETAHYTPSGRLIDRQITLNSQPSTINYHYDSSGNMTNATGNSQNWTLAYDEDNRTTSIAWSSGSTNKTIVNRYDALGRRVSRTLNGIETRYVLSLQGSMERILCDTTASGQITAWYVHGPDLCYKVESTNGLTCYHADAQANIIALTDAATNTIAQYAYTPYGRTLGSTNSSQSTINSQPYTFVGSQGVMEELPGFYFMRARYYTAQAGGFLSTDPVKRIGAGWKSTLYGYAFFNPLRYNDPSGQDVAMVLGAAVAIGATLKYEATISDYHAGYATKEQADKAWPEPFLAILDFAIQGDISTPDTTSGMVAEKGAFSPLSGLDLLYPWEWGKSLAHIIEPDKVKRDSRGTTALQSTDAYQYGSNLNSKQAPTLASALQCSATTSVMSPAGAGAGGGGRSAVINTLESRSKSLGPDNQIDYSTFMCIPAKQPANNTSSSGGFWQGVDNWFNKVFGGGRKKK